MIQARLRTRISQDELDSKVGKVLDTQDYNMVLTGPAKLLKPNGQPLVIYLPGALLHHADDPSTYGTLHGLRTKRTENRGAASGSRRIRSGSGNKTRALPVPSSIVGAFDNSGHHKYCRLTAWTGANLPQWEALHPLLREIAHQFKKHLPERYAVQMEQCRLTYPEWVVPGTPFSTVTVNNCVDPQTEALSKTRGWVTHDQLRTGDEILAYDPQTDTTRWEKLTDVYVNPDYTGPMVALSSRGFSALTTPDHRWPLLPPPGLKRGGKGATVMLTKDLPGGYWGIVRNAPHRNPTTPTYSDAFVRLAAWYYTEGSLLRAGTSINICQSDTHNPVNVEDIRRDLKELGAITLEEWRSRPCTAEPGCTGKVTSRGMCNRHACAARYRAKKDGTSGPDNATWQASRTGRSRRERLVVNEYVRKDAPEMIQWVLTGSEVRAFLEAVPGKDKVPTMEFLSALTAEQAKMFVDISIRGDGSPEYRRFYQHHTGRMDAFMAAATLAGYAVTRDSSGTHCFIRAARTAERPTALINLRSVRREEQQYTGTIWCPRIPSTHWIARRNGSIYATGNTYPTGVHQDAGDLAAGFSTLACLRKGQFTGGNLVFPKYRVALDMQHGDLALIDAHEHHGNTAIVCACGTRCNGMCDTCGAERISIVSYFRANMTKCGTYEEEADKRVARADARNRTRIAAQLDAAEVPQ